MWYRWAARAAIAGASEHRAVAVAGANRWRRFEERRQGRWMLALWAVAVRVQRQSHQEQRVREEDLLRERQEGEGERKRLGDQGAASCAAMELRALSAEAR